MIGSLRGTLLDRSLDGGLLVEAGGVGYRVTTTPELASSIGAIGDEVFVHVHHHVREDAQTLYGFHHEGASVVLPVSNQASELLIHRLAPDSPTRADTAAVARLARENHADLVVFGAVRQKGADWLVTLQMLDAKRGKTVSQVTVPVQPDTVAKGATMP